MTIQVSRRSRLISIAVVFLSMVLILWGYGRYSLWSEKHASAFVYSTTHIELGSEFEVIYSKIMDAGFDFQKCLILEFEDQAFEDFLANDFLTPPQQLAPWSDCPNEDLENILPGASMEHIGYFEDDDPSINDWNMNVFVDRELNLIFLNYFKF